MNWTKITIDGKCEIIHHSTSSTIEIAIFDETTKEIDRLWLDYTQFDLLKKAFKEIENL